MKFILSQYYAPTKVATEPITAWDPQDAQAHSEFQNRMNAELTERGEPARATRRR